jgi:hypothetical protein
VHHETLLVFAAFSLLLGLLISPCSEVEQAADGRRAVRIDLYEVEVAFFSGGQSLGHGENAQVLAPVPDDPNFFCPDPLVYTKLAKYTGVPAKMNS